MNEDDEIMGLKEMTMSSCKEEDRDVASKLMIYMGNAYQIRNDENCKQLDIKFSNVMKGIEDLKKHFDVQLDILKKELGLNGYGHNPRSGKRD
jgi:uncharacterized protein with von Willebrand factor type A (vWA) domain